MKTLLKISCVLAIALFVSMSVKAQDPVTPVQGTISVNVPSHLELLVPNADVQFIWNEYGVSAQTAFTAVEIKANINWTFSLAALNPTFTRPEDARGGVSIDNNKVSLAGLLTGSLSTTPLTKTGTGNMGATDIAWTLAGLGNQYAGTYSNIINYALVAR